MEWKKISVKDLTQNVFQMIGDEWMLVTAEKDGKVNTMTASWGALGIMWGKTVATAYLRPQRYTKEFVDQNEYFTLSFLPEEYRKALNVCGSVSGRDVEDKWQEAGLHPCYVAEGTPEETAAVEEAEMIFVCRKLYAQEMYPECFTEDECDAKWYPQQDYHTMYIAEIVKVLVK